jgi:CheY-like chemotaxis protein
MHAVLIVDDHPEIRHLLRIAVGKEVTLLEAEDGPGALAQVERHHPSVVFLDVMMPGPLDGFQVLQAIRADPANRQTIVALITARSQVADHDKALTCGANAYFIKPFSPFKVGKWMQEQLSSR